jgi:hypothetical protein
MRLFNLFQLSLFNFLANGILQLRLLANYNSQNCESLYDLSGSNLQKVPSQIGKKKSLFVQLRTLIMREDGYLFGVRVEKT